MEQIKIENKTDGSAGSAGETPKVTLWELFKEMFMLSGFTFGGGYVIVAMMQQRFVEKKHWLDEKEMLDLIAIAQASPGVLAVNASIALGYKLHGISGILISVLATILPPFAIIVVVSLIYQKVIHWPAIGWALDGMSAAIAAIITMAVIEMGQKVCKENWQLNLLIIVLAFAASAIFHINVMWIILLAISAGIFKYLTFCFKKKKETNKKEGESL